MSTARISSADIKRLQKVNNLIRSRGLHIHRRIQRVDIYRREQSKCTNSLGVDYTCVLDVQFGCAANRLLQ
jgi:hypothetical protein